MSEKLLPLKVPESLHRKLKTAASMKGVSIQDFVVELLSDRPEMITFPAGTSYNQMTAHVEKLLGNTKNKK